MRSIKKNIFLVLLTGIISAMTFLVYPLQQEYENIFTRIMASFIYAFKCAGMGQNLQILSRIDMKSINGQIYFTLMNLLFVLMPIITASFVLTFVENIISKITFLLLRNKELHIFSEVNSKSLLLAKRLQDDKKARVVFTDDMNENLKLFRKLYNEEIEDK